MISSALKAESGHTAMVGKARRLLTAPTHVGLVSKLPKVSSFIFQNPPDNPMSNLLGSFHPHAPAICYRVARYYAAHSPDDKVWKCGKW
jgi:hypothetical protein